MWVILDSSGKSHRLVYEAQGTSDFSVWLLITKSLMAAARLIVKGSVQAARREGG